MKITASVSLFALAIGGCAANRTETTTSVAAVSGTTTPPQGVTDGLPHPLTAEGARQFIADVEKDLFDLSVISGRAQWVNATYINDDTDALAAYFGTIGTEKGVKYAKQADQYSQVPGIDPDTARKLNILRGALVLAAL